MVSSQLPETIYFPSGVIAIEVTQSLCPLKVLTSSLLLISHSFIVLSSLPETIYFPSGVIASEAILPLCPDSTYSS